jgi:thiol-disulfide isomerase/thioredoxin
MMKKLYISVILVLTVALNSCDKVDDPYEHLDAFISETGDIRFNDTVYSDTTIQNSRRIIIEDFTGMKCPNCPKATDIADTLKSEYPELIIAVAIHNSGNFSEPDDEFTLDLRTETGEFLRNEFQMSFFPSGLINRSDYFNDNDPITGIPQWENTIDQMIQDQSFIEPRFDMKVQSIYNTESRILRLIPTIDVLQPVSGEVRLHAFLLENGIIGPQIDNRKTPSKIPNYEHNHILRHGFPGNGTGRTIFTDAQVGDQFTVESPQDELRTNVSEEWTANNMEVVVYLTEVNTNEIIHSELFKMTNE